ncbi:MAG: HNH endonuclease signature motif containing protein [Bdellovibrionota bacterium]
MNFRNLSDADLEISLKQSVADETHHKIIVLHKLAELERRRLYSKDHPSLFEYCVRVLKYSASSAQRRIDTMRALKLIPEIEQKIISGELNLTSISQAQSFFRNEAKSGKSYNLVEKKEVLEKLENKSTRECIKELITISPQSVPQERRRELTIDKTELKVVLNKDLISKLDKIKALMSHKNPNMTDQELIEAMAEIVIKKIDPIEKIKRIEMRKTKIESLPVPVLKKTTAQKATHQQSKNILETKPAGSRLDASSLKNRQPRKGVSPRYILSAIKQAVYKRDKGQCTHKNCNSNKFLEYDHIIPLAMGGETAIQNLRLLCRTHNQRAAIEKFGFQKMQQYFKSKT